jgi:hypothetical protein
MRVRTGPSAFAVCVTAAGLRHGQGYSEQHGGTSAADGLKA